MLKLTELQIAAVYTIAGCFAFVSYVMCVLGLFFKSIE